jgi:hypothetical protein
MKPVPQTTAFNCMAACVASILEKPLEEVDVEVNWMTSRAELFSRIEKKARCKIYMVPHEQRSTDGGVINSPERYCIASVCTFVYHKEPLHRQSEWHAVVCELMPDGKLTLAFNPDEHDARRSSVDQFGALGNLFIVKANPET